MTNQTQQPASQQPKARAFNAPLAYADYKAKYAAFLVAAVTAFLASAYFTIGYFAGHLRVYEYGYTEWLNFLVGFGITLALTLFQYFLYSRDKGKHGGKAAVAATVVAVCFGLLSEIGQGMERDEARMLARSAESGTYKAVIGALNNAPSAKINPYAGQLAEAERKLAQCREQLAKGKTPHCNGDAQRVESLKASAASAESTAASTSLALVDKSKQLERDEKNYHPLVNLARTTLGFSAIVASFLVSLTIVGFFEYAFHHLGHNFADAKELLLDNGYDVSRKVRTPPRKIDSLDSVNAPYSAPISAFVDSSKLSVKEFAEKAEEALKRTPENIAMSLAKTQHHSEQFYKGVANKLSNDDFKRNLLKSIKHLILTGDMSPALPDVKRWVESSAFVNGIKVADNKLEPIAKAILEVLVKDGTLIKTANGYELKNPNQTYREAINNGFDVYPNAPLDTPINTRVKQSTISPSENIYTCTVHGEENLQGEGVTTVKTPVNSPVNDQKNSSVKTPLTRVLAGSYSNLSDPVNEIGKAFTDDLYEQLKKMVQSGAVKPTFRPVKSKLSEWGVGSNDGNRQQIANDALDKMFSEGVLKLNPDNSNSGIKKAKYVIA